MWSTEQHKRAYLSHRDCWVILENTVPNLYLEIYRELLKNNFIFRFYDLEIGAENRFYNLGEVRIGGAPQNN